MLSITKPNSPLEMKSAIENLKASILLGKSTPEEISLITVSANEFNMLPLLRIALAEITIILLKT